MESRREALQELVARHIAEAEIRIARQRELIDRLTAARRPTDEAEKVLSIMTTVLDTMLETQTIIKRLRRSHLN